jgi:transcriptional regulator with XRE-family HTH domain
MFNKLQIFRFLKQRSERKLYERGPYGSALKMRRKELGLTLREACEGICCLSLLSKIENNLTPASPKHRKLFAKRMGLEDYENLADLNYENHKLVLLDALINQDPFPKDIVESYGNRKDVQERLIKFGYYITIKKYELAEKVVKDIKIYMLQIQDDEVALFLYGLHEILYAQGLYDDAHQMLINIPSNAFKNDKISLLNYKGRLKNAFKLHMITEIIQTYDVFIQLCNKMQYHHVLYEIQNEHILFSAIYQSPKQIKKEIDRMNRLDQKMADYIYATSLYHHQEYDDLIRYIDMYECDEDKWLYLKLLTYDHLKNVEKLIPILQEDQKDKWSPELKLVHRHLRYKYIANSEDSLNYLRREILGLHHITDDYITLNYLSQDAQKMFSQRQFYKEAFQVSSVLSPKIKNLKRFKNQSDVLS